MKESILNDFLSQGLDDWISDQAAHGIANEEPGPEDEEMVPVEVDKFRTLATLKELFEKDIFVPGDLGIDGFIVWKSPQETWLNSIIDIYELHKWRSYGEGFWLSLTEKGRRLAHENLK